MGATAFCTIPDQPKKISKIVDQKVFDQVARYNITHKIGLLAVTNGLQHYYCTVDFNKQDYKFIEDLPEYVNSNKG